MVLFAAGSWVWLEHDEEAFIPVQMVSSKGDKIIARASTGETFELDTNQNYPEVHASSLTHVENMVSMEELSEAAILHNLRLRYSENQIYTYISSILVSINPFKMLPIYSPAIMKEYRDKMSRHEKIAPHVYALADNAYKNLTSDKVNQSVIISGESGAGKTEATKLVLQYMAEMSGQGNDVEQQLLEANPIIEAFGNAKTVRNNNSSRFGKWCEIVFDDRFHIVGAQIYNYLLEKSRIILPGPGERNYHLFYQLCAGLPASERAKLKVGHAGEYRILSIGNTLDVDGVDDADEYKAMRQAMEVLKFSQEEVDDIFRTTSACLHLGNAEFTQSGENAQLKNPTPVEVAAGLLCVDVGALTSALISQRKQMGRESILTFRNQAQAEASRDALTKKIYGNMFNWLIERINRTLTAKVKGSSHIVGVLDIFGFEIFTTNRFEQFCINFANEKMQQHFNLHIFTMEQEEYKAEKIDVAHVAFIDNQPCLDLIENGRNSLLGMTDEEIKLPKGSDDNLLTRMHQSHNGNKYYIKPKTGIPVFSIQHYAGEVQYHIEGFMDKNKDSLESNIAEVVQSSSNNFVKALIPNEGAAKTLGAQFKTQLATLMETLNKTSPHFIRCIKSNNLKVADTFDSQMVLRQLRYLGLKEVVNIRQLGYPMRRAHRDFYLRYKMLLRLDGGDEKTKCQQLLTGVGIAEKDWRVGVTKVFLRNHVSVQLEAMREKKLTKIAVYLQSLARTRIWRRRFLRVKSAVDDLRKAMEGESPEEIDRTIQVYEGLKFKTNTKLIQQAIKIRNKLYEQREAKQGLESAVRTTDLELLSAAVAAAEKVGVEDNFPAMAAAKRIIVDIRAYQTMLATATEKKDLEMLRAAVAKSKELRLNGPKEKQALALITQLEEEARLKANVAAATQSRDIETLKRAIADASSAGLSNDPVVKDASVVLAQLQKEQEEKFQEELKKKEAEVHVFKLAEELKKAIASQDAKQLETTIALALQKGFAAHALTKEAQDLLVVMKKKNEVVTLLSQALISKDEAQLDNAISASQQAGEQVTSTKEYSEAVQLREAQKGINAELDQALATNDDGKLDSLVTRADAIGLKSMQVTRAKKARDDASASRECIMSLSAAMAANNVTLLHTALTKSKQIGLPATHPTVQEAQNLLDVLVAENDTMKQELKAAEASLAAQHKRNVRRSLIVTGQTSLLQQQETKEKEQIRSFDRAIYSQDEFELARYEELRTPNNYAEGPSKEKKGLKSGMLKFDKNVIPKSLLRLNDDGSLSDRAIEVFKMIQGFMLDRHYSFPDTLVSELVTEILLYGALRDEAYVQIMKQLTNNPNPESEQRGWMLLCLLCQAIPPSDGCVNFVLHFIDSKLKPEAGKVSETSSRYAAYALHTLKHTFLHFVDKAPKIGTAEFEAALAAKEEGKYAALITVDHVTAFRERTMIPADVTISFPDASQLSVTINPWENNAQVLLKIAEKIAAVPASSSSSSVPSTTLTAEQTLITDYYGLYEMRGFDQQYQYPHENLLDVQALWSKQERREEVKKSKGFFSSLFSKKEEKKEEDDDWLANPGHRRFLMKRRIYPKGVADQPPVRENKAHMRFLFTQFTKEMSAGWHTYLSETQAMKLAALAKIIQENKSFETIGPLAAPVQASLPTFDLFIKPEVWQCPEKIYISKSKIDPKKFDKGVEKLATEIPAPMCTVDASVDEAKQVQTFGCAFYTVRKVEDKSIPIKMPEDIVLAINYFGLMLLDGKTRAVIDHYPLLNVLGWSSSPVRVVIKVKLNAPVGAGITTVTYRFNTYNPRMGKEICDLFLSYANEMMKAVGLAPIK